MRKTKNIFSKIISGITIAHVILAQVLLAGVFILPNTAFAADTGFEYPGTVSTSSEDPYDDNDWTSKNKIKNDDDVYAKITDDLFDKQNYSHVLKATNFGFNIPAGSTINGIKVRIQRYHENGDAKDAVVQLTKDGITRVGANKAAAAKWPDSETNKAYGGNDDLWDMAWTPAEINASTFGVHLAVKATENDADIYVDFIQIRVFYTPPDTTPPSGGSITYTDGWYTTASVPIEYITGTDIGSDLNLDSGRIQRASAILSETTCGEFGAFSDLVVESDGSYIDTSVANENCYKYQYVISDNAGNAATYTSSNVAKIDTVAPAVTITKKPADFINTIETTIEFTVDDESTTVTCKLDEGDFAACSSPTELSDLAEILHTFVVRAVDEAGNSGIDSASFTVDRTAPSL